MTTHHFIGIYFLAKTSLQGNQQRLQEVSQEKVLYITSVKQQIVVFLFF